MPDYKSLTVDELTSELARLNVLLDDLRSEREFMGRQTGMHMSTSVFARLDQEMEKHEKSVAEIKELLKTRP